MSTNIENSVGHFPPPQWTLRNIPTSQLALQFSLVLSVSWKFMGSAAKIQQLVVILDHFKCPIVEEPSSTSCKVETGNKIKTDIVLVNIVHGSQMIGKNCFGLVWTCIVLLFIRLGWHFSTFAWIWKQTNKPASTLRDQLVNIILNAVITSFRLKSENGSAVLMDSWEMLCAPKVKSISELFSKYAQP